MLGRSFRKIPGPPGLNFNGRFLRVDCKMSSVLLFGNYERYSGMILIYINTQGFNDFSLERWFIDQYYFHFFSLYFLLSFFRKNPIIYIHLLLVYHRIDFFIYSQIFYVKLISSAN